MRVSLQHKTKPSKGLHPGLAWLLRDCKYEDNDAKMGPMAAAEGSDAISGNNGRSPEREQRVSFNWAYRNGMRGR